MKNFIKKLLILTLALVTAISFSNLLSRPSKASAADASAPDENLNVTQIAEDFEFIKQFYVEDDYIDTVFSTTYNTDMLSDKQPCRIFYYDVSLNYDDKGFTLYPGQTINLTVPAGIEIIQLCGVPMSYIDSTKTVKGTGIFNYDYYLKPDVASLPVFNWFEDSWPTYFIHVLPSSEDRTVVIDGSSFFEPLFIVSMQYFSTVKLGIAEYYEKLYSGELNTYETFLPDLSKTIVKNRVLTSPRIIYGSGSASDYYDTVGYINGFYNGIYDCLNGLPRKQDFTGNDRILPEDVTDSSAQKEMKSAHKEGYAESFDYIDENKTQSTDTSYDHTNLPWIENYQGDYDKLEAFIKNYCSDLIGHIFSEVNEENYKTVLGGKTEWNSFMDEEKEIINNRLALVNGNTVCGSYNTMLSTAVDIDLALDFIKNHLTDEEGRIIIKGTAENYEKLNNESYLVYVLLTDGAKDIVTSKITEANEGFPKAFEDLLSEATKAYNKKYNHDYVGPEGNDVDGKTEKEQEVASQIKDYDLDFGNWNPENFIENLERLFEDPGKFFKKFGEALGRGANSLWLVLKVIVAVVVAFLLFKGIKALVDLFKD